MKIYIELVIIFAAMLLFIFWYLWRAWSTKRLLKKYNPENDKARKGGEECKSTERAESVTRKPDESSVGSEQPERPELLPTTSVNNVGETSNSNRKNGNSIRKLLRRK